MQLSNSTKAPKFSVIIPVFRDWHRLAKCLDALRAQVEGSPEAQIVIVNNDPESPPPASLHVDDVLMLNQPVPGSYSARNLGVAHATCKYLAFTDADCIPSEDWLFQASRAFDESNAELLLGAVKLFPVDSASITVVEAYDLILGFSSNTAIKNIATGVTANLFVTKACMDALGGFDARYFSGGDFHFIRTALSRGHVTEFDERVCVWHPARSRLGEVISKARRKIGARIQRRQEKSTFSKILYIVKPPLSSIRKIWKCRDFSIRHRLGAVGVAVLVYLSVVIEGFAVMSIRKRAVR